MQSLKIISPNGHLGFAPIRTGSFALGVAARPHYIAADSGSDDVGPVPLGADICTSPESWQRHDLKHMLLASRKTGVRSLPNQRIETSDHCPRIATLKF